jgi:hypothetical protein
LTKLCATDLKIISQGTFQLLIKIFWLVLFCLNLCDRLIVSFLISWLQTLLGLQTSSTEELQNQDEILKICVQSHKIFFDCSKWLCI